MNILNRFYYGFKRVPTLFEGPGLSNRNRVERAVGTMPARGSGGRKTRFLVAVYLSGAAMKQLRSRANRERRSLSKQALVYIENGLRSKSRTE